MTQSVTNQLFDCRPVADKKKCKIDPDTLSRLGITVVRDTLLGFHWSQVFRYPPESAHPFLLLHIGQLCFVHDARMNLFQSRFPVLHSVQNVEPKDKDDQATLSIETVLKIAPTVRMSTLDFSLIFGQDTTLYRPDDELVKSGKQKLLVLDPRSNNPAIYVRHEVQPFPKQLAGGTVVMRLYFKPLV